MLTESSSPATGSDQSGQKIANRPSFFRRRTKPAEPVEPRTSMPPRKRRRKPTAAIFSLLRRLWLALVVLAVVAVGAFTVSRIHGIFGSQTSLPYGDTSQESAVALGNSAKLMRYEVFGPPGTVAQISYFDGKGDVDNARNVSLPWTLEFPITTAASIGSVAAQGDSGSIGCRITIDGVVKAEKITEAVSAFTSCMLKNA